MPTKLKRPQPKGFTPVKAAGKSISAKNEDRIRKAIDGLVDAAEALKEILGEAGVLDSGEGDGEEETQAAKRLDVQTPETLVEASDFTNYIDMTSWYQRLDNVLWCFSYFFQDAVMDAAEGEGTGEVDQLIADLSTYLQELATSYPVISASLAQLAAAQPGHEQEEIYTLPCDFTLVEAAAHGNRYPIEGKLFTVDQLSEGVPAVGPGRKLYIPRSVAEEAVNQCVGLPLDAADSLSEHANDEIVGVMLGANLKKDNGFWVRASLFPFNQPEKVAQIRANKESLGFSINAYMPGHVGEVNGEEAYIADKLVLLGANILYKSAATFQQTELVASAQVPAAEPPVPGHRGGGRRSRLKPSAGFAEAVGLVAASNMTQPQAPAVQAESQVAEANPTPENINSGDEPMTEEFKQLLEAQNAQIKAQGEQIAQLSDAIAPLSDALRILVDERNARKQEEEKVAAQAEERKQQETMQAMIRDTTKKTLADLLNPTHSPARISSGVVAASTSTAVNPDSLEGHIMQLEARLAEAQRSSDPQMMARRMQLRDEIHSLKQQIPAAI